jgi:predicted DsbA family dithiol-disulfide isomerase
MLVSTNLVRGQSEDRVVATVNGTALRLAEVDAAATAKIFSLQQQIYALRKSALENLISRKVLEIEATRRHISVDQLKNQLLSGPVNVSPNQVEAVYLENLSAFGSMNADEAREKIRLDLEAQARLRGYREELAKLRKTVNVELMFDEPRLPVPSTSDFASTGSANAEVVITEFSDFQCPYCKAVQPTLKQLLREYEGRVRLDFKHLPLEQHPLAAASAQAAFCSGKQGHFWEYHDALFATDGISKESLQSAAVKSGLQPDAFQACLDSQESRSAVVSDLREAKRLGIESTPTFLINGKLLRGAASLDQFKLIIDRELRTAQSASAGQRK